jgi:uncharacterized protein
MNEPVQAPVIQPVKESYPFWTYEDLAIFFGLGLPCLLLSVVLSKIVFAIAGYTPPNKALQLFPAQFIGYAFWFASLYLLLKVKYGRPLLASLAWIRPKGGWAPMSVFMGPVLAFAVGLLGVVLKTPQIEMPFRDMLNDRMSIFMFGLFAVTLGPLSEELAFRGFLMPLLVRSLGPVPGIVITALPFALLHGPQYSWSWRHLVLLTLAGTVFGCIRHYTGSTRAAAMTHATYNLTFFSAFLAQQGNVP